MNIGYPITIEETTDWHNRARLNTKRIDFALFEGADLVAMSGLTGLDVENSLIEFYVMVGPGWQGKGFGNKLTIWTINYAFLNYNVNKVYLYTNAFNEPANKLYEKLGFQLEGKLRQHKFRDGKFIDRYMFGLLKEDWLKQQYHKNETVLEF
jgi:RimJ/RimL family protein N-acetyltransferase